MKKIEWILLVLLIGLAFFLRVYNVATNPPGLYLDEVSIGLNAYDILTTGKDQYLQDHPLFFAAYGEYKMPVYIYLTSAAMYFFGKNEFAIRFPSILFGSLTIGVVFFLFKLLLEEEIKKKKLVIFLSSIGSLALATSSWHLQFSRAGFEATVALFFYMCALVSCVYFWKRKKIIFYVCACLFLLVTFYTYDGYRLIVPLTVIGCFFIFWKKNIQRQSLTFVNIFLAIGLFPLILFSFTGGGLMRFSQTSAFSQYHFPQLWQQLLADVVTYIRNYISFFSFTFLFTVGDQINRHQVQGFGLLYVWQLPFLILGLMSLPRLKSVLLKYGIIFLLLIAPLAAAVTVPSPHTLRFLMAIIPLTGITVLGMYRCSRISEKRKTMRLSIFIATFLFAIIQFGYYFDYYYIHYAKNAIFDWGGECKEVAQKLQIIEKKFDTIYVDKNFMCVIDYFSFYSPHVKINYVQLNQLQKLETNQHILLLKHKNEHNPQGEIIERVYIPNLNHDVFAEFWKI